jgi:hypothetical protein
MRLRNYFQNAYKTPGLHLPPCISQGSTANDFSWEFSENDLKDRGVVEGTEEGLVFVDRAVVATGGLVSDRNSVDNPSI